VDSPGLRSSTGGAVVRLRLAVVAAILSSSYLPSWSVISSSLEYGNITEPRSFRLSTPEGREREAGLRGDRGEGGGRGDSSKI